MNCTNCDFGAKIKDAEHAGIRYEDTPCASCKLTEDSSHTLEFDEARDAPESGGRSALVHYCGRALAEDGGQADDPALPLSVLAEALREILTLPPDTLHVLQARYLGRSYVEIGRETGTTAQAAEVKVRRLLEKNAHLRHLLPAKARKQEARKRKRRSMARRGKVGSSKVREF